MTLPPNPGPPSEGPKTSVGQSAIAPECPPCPVQSAAAQWPTPHPCAPQVRTLAGSIDAGFCDGVGRRARFCGPSAVAADVKGNVIVTDSDNHRIRMISPQKQVSTIGCMLPSKLWWEKEDVIVRPYIPCKIPMWVELDAGGALVVTAMSDHHVFLVKPDP